MKNWIKKIGGMALASAILVSGSGAVHAADVKYGMTGATVLAAMHMQSVSETPQPTVATISEYQQNAVEERKAAPATESKPSVPTVAGKEYSRSLDIVATAYSPSNAANEYGGLTYMGTKVRPGVIAVDPKVIPLGTKVYITGYNSPLLPAGGFVATAEDTGGAIKGNRIDIFLNGTQQQVLNFGKQNVKVYVLK